MPAWNPLVRVIGDKLIMPAHGPAAGQARLEFNIASRLCSAFWAWPDVLDLYGAAVGGVKREWERGTWLGLIATSLSGCEILRAMMLGPVLSRLRALDIIALWTVGLMAGAVHPLGFLAAVTGLVVLPGFFGTGRFQVAAGGRMKGPATR